MNHMARLSQADRRTLVTVYEAGGVRPPADIPGGRKLYAANLKLLRRLEAAGWLASDVEELGADYFTLTQAGADAIGVTLEDET